jgi:hypothetical protein
MGKSSTAGIARFLLATHLCHNRLSRSYSPRGILSITPSIAYETNIDLSTCIPVLPSTGARYLIIAARKRKPSARTEGERKAKENRARCEGGGGEGGGGGGGGGRVARIAAESRNDPSRSIANGDRESPSRRVADEEETRGRITRSKLCHSRVFDGFARR